MTQGIGMERAGITLLAFLNPPIDWDVTLLAFLNPPIDWDDSFNMPFLVRN
jgi:hypothetical protein